MAETYTPDETDRKIISLLMKNARMSVKEIAKELYLTSPTVSTRIKKLRENGIITGFHASVDSSYFGYNIKAFVNLEVDPKDKKEFYDFIEKIPNVIECNCVTGEYSMIIEVAFKRTEELDHLINVLQKYGHTKTLIVFSTSVEHRDVPV
ncbi:MAG: Lrp/AsnC family transcriptional regulator [Lachnospiraceae bacterium]|nr:Lrp/AsnC family transcriptional regulator [Lachnospiraceae bacterium]MDD7327708.1 Lrp/AsnC family transcriptional regulator [Lachnospiraceae bacterium]MDY2758776.1 Lrp/AsnC family transcriptional regulator [Lachnospiraceae bacterium]